MRAASTVPGETGTATTVSTALPAVAASVVCMRRQAAAFAAEAGGSADAVDRVRLAVSEAVTNVVEHAYAGGEVGCVQMQAAVEGGELLVLVSDGGSGLNPRRVSRGLGLGLALMADVCDGLTIAARSSSGVDVQMRFLLAAPDGEWRGQRRGSSASALRPAAPSFSTTT